METNTLSVRERNNMGKSYARRLRRDGQAPAIAYTGGNDPIHFELTPGPLLKILRDSGKNTVLTLQPSELVLVVGRIILMRVVE